MLFNNEGNSGVENPYTNKKRKEIIIPKYFPSATLHLKKSDEQQKGKFTEFCYQKIKKLAK